MFIARYFGADIGTDAFIVAFKIPNFLRRLFAEGSFSQAFVPVLSDYRQNRDPAGTRAFLDRMAGSMMVVLAVLSLFGVLAAPLLILLFAPGFHDEPEKYQLSVAMLRVTFPYLFFICMTALAGGILNTSGHFAIPSATPVLLNVVMIAAMIWLAPHLSQPVMALAYGVLLAGLAQFLLQIPALLSHKLLPLPRPGFSDAGVRRTMKLMAPALVGASMGQVNLLINTLIASFLVSGSVSWLYYSDRLVEFPLGIFGIAIGTVILPHLSKHHAGKAEQEFSKSLDWALRWVALIGIPATLGLLLLAEPLMLTLFQYDRFTPYDALMASRSLMAYAIGLMGFIGVKVMVPSFSAREDLATPARYGIYSVVANIVLSLVLVFLVAPEGWSHAALALSASLAALFNAGLLLVKLARDGVYTPETGWLRFFGQITLANMVMAGVLIYASNSFPWGEWSTLERVSGLGLWIVLAFLAYAVMLGITGIRPKALLLAEQSEGH